ncbi:MAG TPA: TIGR01212 family radical SAM protein [Firmicutes bacterium]|nr:TIGR01212 family radical SAM protein [Bacillota bacterium]
MKPYGWYYRLKDFFQEKFGYRVRKIPLAAGLSCPNRDGTISEGGCIYCYNPGFSPGVLTGVQECSPLPPGEIAKQIHSFQARMEKRQEEDFRPEGKYLAYFQAYSNTYGEPAYLESLYREALGCPGIVGLSIATRPDCLSDAILKVLESLAAETHLWLELGLQTAHDRTLKLINRGHDFACFQEAVLACRGKGIYLCAHIINGLPGESREDMLETVRRLNELELDGIKFHHLQVIKNTALHAMYERLEFKLLSLEEYTGILCDQLEIMRRDMVVHRLMSEITDKQLLVAPQWRIHPGLFASMVERELRRRKSFQGCKHVKK